MTINLEALATAAIKDKDYTKTTEGGSFERKLPEAGVGYARLREYIELGIHTHGGGQFAKDRPMARFVFELCHKKHQQEFEKDGVKKYVPHTVAVTVPVSDNCSSDYIKIFNLLNWQGTYKHPMQALGQPMMCKVIISDNGKEGAEKREYVNLWTGTPKDKSWTFQPPVVVDPVSDTSKDISAAIPQLAGGDESIKVFLWLHADMAQWDSLFIEGTKTVKDKEGKEKEQSKNWIQDKIKSAKNYAGSPIEQLLATGGEDLDLTTDAPSNESTDDILSDLGI